MILKVLQDTGDAVQEKIRNEMGKYKEEVEERKLELIDIAIAKVECIEGQGNISLKQLNEALKSSIDILDSRLQEIKEKLEQEKQNIKDAGTEAVQRVTEEKEKTLREIKNVKEGKNFKKNFKKSLSINTLINSLYVTFDSALGTYFSPGLCTHHLHRHRQLRELIHARINVRPGPTRLKHAKESFWQSISQFCPLI